MDGGYVSTHSNERCRTLGFPVSHKESVKYIEIYLGSRVAQRSKALQLSARGVTTDTLVRTQAVSQPAVIESPTGRRTIGPASSGLACVGRYGLN